MSTPSMGSSRHDVAAAPPGIRYSSPSLRLSGTARERLFGYGLLLPSLAVIALVILYPLVEGFRISLFRMRLISTSPPRFVGPDNYVELLQDPQFWFTLRTT